MDTAQTATAGPRTAGSTPVAGTPSPAPSDFAASKPGDSAVPAAGGPGGDASPAVGGPAVPAAGTVAASRSARRPRDLVLSLLILLVPVLLLVGAYRVLQRGDEPVLVDAAPALAEAKTAGDFPVAQPVRLSQGWRTVSARYVPGDGQAVLRVGYLSPSGAGFQLVESDRPADALLAGELTSGARPLGAENIAGRDWQRYQGRPGEQALVLLEPERTLIVVGTGPSGELTALASALFS